MRNDWTCDKCGYSWHGQCPICPLCQNIGYELDKKDLLDSEEIYSIDEVLEEIEGKDDNNYNQPT